LFESDRYDDPPKVDIWATAATVYKVVSGKFPFIDPGENVPRISTPEDRAQFEETIRARIRAEWDQRVNVAALPEPLRPVLERALVHKPEDRATAAEMVTLCEKYLAGFLRSAPGNGGLTALQELRQLLDNLPRNEALRLMPYAAKQLLSDRLKAFKQIDNLDRGDAQTVDDLLARLG
jgi:serine/threonine protein kinase